MTDSERPRLTRPRVSLQQSIALWSLGAVCGVVALILGMTDTGGDAPIWLTFGTIGLFAVGTFSEIP